MKNKIIILMGAVIIVSLIAGGYILFNSNQGNQDKNNNTVVATSNPHPEEKNNTGMKLNSGTEEVNKSSDANLSLSIHKNETYENPVEEKEKNTSMSLNTGKNETYAYEKLIKENRTNEIIESTASKSQKLAVYRDKLEKNAPPPFKVGKEYIYNSTEQNYEGIWTSITKYVVEKTEVVDGREYYAVSEYTRNVFSEENKEFLREKNISDEEIKKREIVEYMKTTFYDKENGKIIQQLVPIEPSYILLPKDKVGVDDPAVFSDWMLALNDNFTWEQKIIVDDDSSTDDAIYKYKVNGREKANGRECFKVERNLNGSIVSKGLGNSLNFTSQRTIWIDVNERIMVKLIPDSDNDNPTIMLQLINEQ